jgi:CheY-like chemotaxis protein
MAILAGHDPDVALLDVNLGRSDVFGVANELATRKTKLIFLTGHTAQKLPLAHRHRPLVGKPYMPHVLLHAVQMALSQQDDAA